MNEEISDIKYDPYNDGLIVKFKSGTLYRIRF